MRRLLIVLFVFPLAACAGGGKPGSLPPASPTPPVVTPIAPPPTAAPPAPSETSEVRALAAVTGTVTYRLRVALTPEAEVQVELRDVSRQDVETPLIAKRVIVKPGQVPIPFSLEYDPSLIEPGRSYAVSARISDRGQLQFVTDSPIPVVTNGAPMPVEIVVVPVR